VVVVDLAPLRSSSLAWAVESSLSLAAAAGARRLGPEERPLIAVPFDCIPVDLPLTVEQVRGRSLCHRQCLVGLAQSTRKSHVYDRTVLSVNDALQQD
jgi:hypothetical protein